MGITSSTVLRTPLDLHFGVILGGGLGATILPLGCPWRPLEPLLELSWAPVGVTGPSLGALWDSLRGFGWVLSLRREVPKVCVLEHLGTARAPLYCFRGSFALARLPLGLPGPPLTPLWVSPGALWVRFRCYFCVFGRPLDVGPVSVLFGVGRDVRSVHACACLVRVRLVKKDCLLRPSCGSQKGIKEARRA